MQARFLLACGKLPPIRASICSRAFSCQSSLVMNEKTAALAEGIRNSKRDCLARAITLIESTNKEHRNQAKLLLEAIAYDRNALDRNVKPTVRLGIAGPPGIYL